MSSQETPNPLATTSRATRGTPYSPVYGAEACLPPETLLDSPRVQPSNKSMRKRLQREDENSIVKRRWEPRVRTWSYGKYKTKKGSTNSPPDGKDPSRRRKCADPGMIISL
jgi:hypothetical protein